MNAPTESSPRHAPSGQWPGDPTFADTPASPVNPARRERWLAWGVRLGLLLLVAVVFGQALRFDFVDLDDSLYVVYNPYVQQPSLEGVGWAFTATRPAANWHPFTWLSLQFDTLVWGRSPRGYHLTNVLLHALNSLLVFGCLRQATGRLGASALIAALFAVHPLHVESVAWIAERKDVLSTLFGLLALAAYLQHVRRREPGWLFLTGLALLGSLLSKQMLVTFPLWLLLFDYWPLNRLAELPPRERWRQLAREKLGLFVLCGLFCLVAVVAQASGSAVQSLDRFPLWVRVGNAFAAYAAYVWQTCVPTKLSVFYPHPGTGLPVGLVGGSLLVLAGLTWLARWARPRAPWVWMGWLWFLLLLLPVIGLVQVGTQQRADRYTYLPIVGLFVAVVMTLDSVLAKGWPRWLASFGSLGLVGVLAVLAHAQVGVWKETVTLFEHAVKVTAPNAFASNSLGQKLQSLGRLPEADACYQEALQADPASVPALTGLASLRQAAGDFPAARELLDRARELSPRNPQVNTQLADLFVAEGDAEKALTFYRQAISIDPFDGIPREGLNLVLLEQGRAEEALRDLDEWKQLTPRDPRVYNALANTMVRLERPAEAEGLLQQALRLDPEYARARTNLGILKYRLGDFETAIDHFKKALQLDPANPASIDNLSGAYVSAGVEAAKQNDGLRAKQFLDQALGLTPRSFFALHRMGRIAVDNGFRVEARDFFERALAADADLRRVQSGDIAMCHYDLGLLLAVQDQFEEALPHFAKAVELVPDFEPARAALGRSQRLKEKMSEQKPPPLK